MIFSIRNKASVLSGKSKKLLLIDPELFSIFEQDEKNICLLICRLYDAYITIISVSEYLEEKKSGIQPGDREIFMSLKNIDFPQPENIYDQKINSMNLGFRSYCKNKFIVTICLNIK